MSVRIPKVIHMILHYIPIFLPVRIPWAPIMRYNELSESIPLKNIVCQNPLGFPTHRLEHSHDWCINISNYMKDMLYTDYYM